MIRCAGQLSAVLAVAAVLAAAPAALADPAKDSSGGPAAASAGPTPTAAAPAPAPAVDLPPAPDLAPVAMPHPPASFCSEIDRGHYLAEVFNPAVDTTNANVAKANAHLDELNRIVATGTSFQVQDAARRAFSAYRPISDQTYHFGLDVLALHPAIMAAPIAPCGAPKPEAVSAPPPPRTLARDDPAPAPLDPRPTARAYERADPAVAEAAPIGPKRTVAVGVIQGSGGFTKDEDWQAGPALQAMLSKSLVVQNRVIVVERDQLDQVLNEQQLRASHVTGGSPDLTIKMIPAQYLVLGSVTEFGSPNSGGGFSIGGGQGDLIGGLGIKRETGKVSIDLRILNTRTGQVVEAFTVSKTVSRTGVSVTTDYRGLSVGSDAFNKTPLGEACRQALDEAADRIADLVSRSGWEAKVVEADGDEVFVNAGAEAGLGAGARLRIERIGRTLTDPDTGQTLSERRETLGELVIEGAEAKVAHGHFTPASPGEQPQRGDLVTLEDGSQP